MSIERTDAIIAWDEANQVFDISIGDNGDLATDIDLKTSLLISILADRRSLNNDSIPNSRGWVGDAIKEESATIIGSRIWLLGRRKQTNQTLQELEIYAQEALDWYVDQGIAEDYNLQVFHQDKLRGITGLDVELIRPEGNILKTFNFTWEQFDS
jgi:phage gp46-like protein